MLFIPVLPCLGQAGKATLSGEISDPAGLPVVRAQVNAEEQATNALFSTISDERGEYRLLGLLPGEYVLTVKAPWGPLLMSAEIENDSSSTLVRARYGIRPPFAIGARVSLSDLVFYKPYGSFPTSVEEMLPHALATQKVRANEPLGVYWEAYNTNPAGEKMTISLVVAPDDDKEPGRMTRAARALRLSRGTSPVSVTMEDMSLRGARTSPRAVHLDISTLTPGDYLVQLEVDVAGQYVIRADRRITVVPR